MMADMHTHSVNSHDSVCEIEDMCLMQIKRGTNIFAVTDHCDVFSYKDYDIYTPIRNSADTVRTLNEKYGEKCLILSGVEISEGFWYKSEYEKIHSLLAYDVILGSVHCVKFKDLEKPYSGIDFSKFTSEQIYSYMDCYFNDLLEMLSTTDFDVLAHMTCLLTLYEPKNTTYWRSVGIKEKIQSIVDYANSNDKIDFVIVGGDIVNGYETVYSPGYKTALDDPTTGVTNVHNYVTYQIKTVLGPLKDCKKPVFVIPGNHDDNKAQAIVYNNIINKLGIDVDESIKTQGFNIKDIVTDIDWKHDIFDNFVTKGAVQDASYTANDIVDASYTGDKQEKLSKYYYYDLENKNTRVFCLDVMDTRHKLDADGNVAAFDSSNHVSYSPQQLKWLAENLEQAKGDIIILSHMAADSKNDGARNCDYLLKILGAYQNRSTCSITIGDTVIEADFTTAAGKILSYSAGHIHADRTSFSEEANIWQIFSGMGSGCGNVVSATKNVIYKYFVDFNHWFTGKDEKLLYPVKK